MTVPVFDNLEKMLSRLDDMRFDRAVRHFERLGAVGILFAGTAGLFRYAHNILPSAPSLVYMVGVISLLSVFFLIVLVGLGAWGDVLKSVSRPWVGHVFGLLVFCAVILLGVGGLFWAINAVPNIPESHSATATEVTVSSSGLLSKLSAYIEAVEISGATLAIISSLLSGLVGVIVSSVFYNHLEERRYKRETVRRLLGARFDIGGDAFRSAMNEIPVVFSDSRDVMDRLEEFWAELRTDKKAAADPKLAALLKAVCVEVKVIHKNADERFYLRYFNAPSAPQGASIGAPGERGVAP